jgi:hypothetical protein
MANTYNGNTLYFDAAGSLREGTLIKVTSILVTAESANAVVVLTDAATNSTKLELRVAAAGTTEQFDFSESVLIFPTGVEVTTLTNANVTLMVKSD